MIQLLALAIIAAPQIGNQFKGQQSRVLQQTNPLIQALNGNAAQLVLSTNSGAVSIPFITANFDVLQPLNIGSQSSGAGAGKVVFNPLVLTRAFDKNSPILFQAATAGTAFSTAMLNTPTMTASFRLLAVKSDAYAVQVDGSVIETVSFEYGGLSLAAK